VMSATAGALVGGSNNAMAVNVAATTGGNAAANNWLSQHSTTPPKLSEQDAYNAAVAACSPSNQAACQTAKDLSALSAKRDTTLNSDCQGGSSVGCTQSAQSAFNSGNTVFTTSTGQTMAVPNGTPIIGDAPLQNNIADAFYKPVAGAVLLGTNAGAVTGGESISVIQSVGAGVISAVVNLGASVAKEGTDTLNNASTYVNAGAAFVSGASTLGKGVGLQH